ncbi:MAG TPA: GAF domain-containing SpoIIE family protein phosphatase [Candidatus Polarisedimenticolaceae bacterium]|nr:GAF domain-containing SpoIIE family protein phosphatase [Candidatus Polarisedimenticolaceae bacterium]
MSDRPARSRQLDAATLESILEVTRRLAAPFELDEILARIIDAGRAVLAADRGTVFLLDETTDELVVRVGTGVRELRIPAGKGIAGECAQSRRLINVPDCYADARFNRDVDRESGYRTRCLLAVPLIAEQDRLVGVLQLLNKKRGTFSQRDERIASALAAQCAVALERVRMTQELLEKERMQRELAVAREIQTGFLPRKLPRVDGYDLAGVTEPAEETGGDTFDWIGSGPRGAVMLVGDATGHGVGPALSATQVRAMVRIAGRLGASLEQTLAHVNDQLTEDLAANRMVTAFLGRLDADAGKLFYHAAGQGPLLHYHAATDQCEWRNSTAPPLGCIASLPVPKPAEFVLAPGDVVGVMTDGIFEYADARERMFGETGVAEVVRRHHDRPMSELVRLLFDAARRHADGRPPADDITIVLVRRLPSG